MQFGWLDATVFIHALFENDPHMQRCRQILRTLERGGGQGWVDPVTIHELTYALPRVRPESFRSREDVFGYLTRFLALDSIHADDKEALISSLRLWVERGVKFGDARLLALAQQRGAPVCTVNQRDFGGVENSYPAVHLK
jgi:predicted nucleic acid-binding protein